MRALLDVNVLIALLHTQHVHHENARHWLGNNIQHGWAKRSSPGITNSGPTTRAFWTPAWSIGDE